MNKFNIGDKVRVKNVEVGTNSYGATFVSTMSKLIGEKVTIKERWRDNIYILEELSYFWAEDWLEPVKHETIVIYRNDDKTVAIDKGTGKKAEAICSKEDEYDFYTGARIAFERLIGEDTAKEESKPKLYSGKVVCIKPRRRYLTKGKIYEFKDGFSKYDNGDRMPLDGDGFTSFKDLEESMCSQFVEIVED